MTQIEEKRRELLMATLDHVPFDGWTLAALRAGARDLGISQVEAENAFPNAPSDLIEALSEEFDQRMLDALEDHDMAALGVVERITLAIRLRLEALESHRDALRRMFAYLALPQNAVLGARLLFRSVDAMWYAAGDQATDYNYYTKRLLLAGVFSSTFLVWLDDTSEDSAATWAFLERRIKGVLRLGGSVGKAVDGILDFPDRMASRMGAGPLRAPRARRRTRRRA